MSVTEARPISLDRLDDHEKSILKKINERLLDMASDESPDIYPDASPWARVENRSGRVLALCGVRGTGKTSLLLTLLKEWNEARQPGAVANELSESFASVAKRVRTLRILDFDPLPDAMPLHGWLLQPWRRLAELADRGGDVRPGRSDGQAVTLRERWHELFETATIGWSKVPPDGRGVVERALDHEMQGSGWIELRDQWCTFVTDLLFSLTVGSDSANALPLPGNCVVVVPIDDVDLQVRRLPELLHAIRLLHHPRVVYLLTADVEHMKEVLEFDYQQKHRKLSGVRDDSNDERIRKRSKELAAAQLEKGIPTHAQFSLRRVGLKEILEHRSPSGTLQEVLNSRKWEGGKGLGTWLKDEAKKFKAKELFDELLTYRQLQHVCDRISEMKGDEGEESNQAAEKGKNSDSKENSAYVGDGVVAPVPAARADETIRTLIDPEGLYTRPGGEPPVRYDRDGTVYAWSRTILGSDWVKPQQARIVRGTDLEYRILKEADGKLGEPDSNAALAALLNEGGLVSAPALEWEVGPAMVWTQWRNSPGNAVFLWPLCKHLNPVELNQAQSNWARFIRGQPDKDARKRDDELDSIARAWLSLTVDWAQGKFKTEEVPENWSEIINKAVEWSKSSMDSKENAANLATLKRNLFLLSSPGVGLPSTTRKTICEELAKGEFSTKGVWSIDQEAWERELTDALIQASLLIDRSMTVPRREDIEQFCEELSGLENAPKWRELFAKKKS